MVFNAVVSASAKVLCYFGPAVAHDSMGEVEHHFLFAVPLYFPDDGVEVIVPPFSALLAHTTLLIIYVPGMCSAITVHLCGPYLLTSLRR